MKVTAKHANLSGKIQVPGSKSHTIRALLLACLSEGTSHIKNPLCSADCLSASRAIPLFGSEVFLDEKNPSIGQVWTIKGAGKDIHLPENIIDVGNSGSLLYFLSPIASTFEGWSVFTGDESIRKRPVSHVVDAIKQLGCEAFTSDPNHDGCPLIIHGHSLKGSLVRTGGELSQYVSGMMMAATRMEGKLKIELSNPKETPYLKMTSSWLESLGVKVKISDDFREIEVEGSSSLKAFDRTVPSDWEAVAFPLIAALLTDSEIIIENIDTGGTQGDEAIVDVLKSLGADISLDIEKKTLTVRGGKKAKNGVGRLSTEGISGGELHVNLSGYPDAVCALAAISCFVEGTTYIEDIGVCRKKETDRIKVLKSELGKTGASIEEGEDFLIIKGHSPFLKDGSKNPHFSLHGAETESFLDHRVSMALSCLALALPEGESLTINDAECCSVSFPGFFDAMNRLGAGFSFKE